MSYQDALDLKNSKKENPFFKDGIEYVWMVIPLTEVYFGEYAKDCLTTSEVFFDETAKRYAKDNLFDIFGVRMRR